MKTILSRGLNSADLLSNTDKVVAHLWIEHFSDGACQGEWRSDGDLRGVVDLSLRYADELSENLLGHASETMDQIISMGFQIRASGGELILPKLLMVMPDGKIWYRESIS